MSWYSDGGPFDEWEGCEHCNFKNGSSPETCRRCPDGGNEGWGDEEEEDEEDGE